ncbi:hypothetical protein Lepto7376_2032 [[Leptolyngbya] sp. PCC 7376]|uniref:hypothetical protein n=1 Tax=[Leptolyngbya] sp. PCC 7376 TaxID=111781 RepID=UPI00029F272D|nr:hypothetical protein [[Leptolyngbya] sp. PCC 7376]AFY38334.1 hypothetical protein Lepto7376_2032 [[Leptolyngbya] sp. PCC 7376]
MTDQAPNFNNTPIGQCALQFAQALVDLDFEKAASYLASELQGENAAEQLRQQYLTMIDYWDTPAVDMIEALELLDDWPNKQPNDWGWVYVAVDGDGFGEAVAVVITMDRKIREIEWGRP